ncbi:PilZ domain-containing protein [Novosphingobium profundi]|nr:PilZ domain-containing protein [Novosphingobium profundi]
MLICEVRQGSRPWRLVRLEDLSPEGFRIAWLPDVQAHVPLRIRIPGLQMLTAEVRWTKGDGVGCAFTAPLHVAVFEHLVRQRSD